MIVHYSYLGLPVRGMNRKRDQMQLPDAATLEDFVARMVEQYPGLTKAYLAKCTIMVNRVKAANHLILQDGDEILLLTVLGGG